MRKTDYIDTKAEISWLSEMLERIPLRNVIDRLSITERIQELEQRLIDDPLELISPKRAKLSLHGKHLRTSHGISAEFGIKVLSSFVEAIYDISNSKIDIISSTLKPVQDNLRNKLLILSTTSESYCFEVEDNQDSVAKALDRFLIVMKASTRTDNELVDSLKGLHPQAIESIILFFKNIDSADALCALEIDDEVFRFKDSAQFKKSILRLSNVKGELKEKISVWANLLSYSLEKSKFDFQKHDRIFESLLHNIRKTHELQESNFGIITRKNMLQGISSVVLQKYIEIQEITNLESENNNDQHDIIQGHIWPHFKDISDLKERLWSGTVDLYTEQESNLKEKSQTTILGLKKKKL